MSGWHDLPLSDRGRQQAERVRVGLGAALGGCVIVSSSSRRAADTARAILPPDEILSTRDDLREISCGAVDGLPVSEVKARYPALWAANERQEDPDFRWPGGESYRELRERCLRAIDEIAAAHPGRTIVVVTHAGVISQLVGAVNGTSPARWGAFRPDNCSITEALWGNGRRTIVRFDDHSHLPPSSSTRLHGE